MHLAMLYKPSTSFPIYTPLPCHDLPDYVGNGEVDESYNIILSV